MRAQLCVLVLFASACGTEPVESHYSGCAWSDDVISESIGDFTTQYVNTFQLDDKDQNRMFNMERRVLVHCEATERVPSAISRDLVRGYTVIDEDGLIVLSTGIDSWKSIGQSSLFHELMHMSLFYLEGDSDHDHGDGKGPWTAKHDDLIRNMKLEYRGCIENTDDSNECWRGVHISVD